MGSVATFRTSRRSFSTRSRRGTPTLAVFAFVSLLCLDKPRSDAADWPMFGKDATRNPVSFEADPPLDWDVGKHNRRTGEREDEGRNVAWWAALGPGIYASPVISDGLVWMGANRWERKDDGPQQDAALLRCYREKDGKMLYEYVSPRLKRGGKEDPPWHGLSCSPSVVGDRLWCFTNRCEVICLDIGPLKQSEGEPKLLWKTDLLSLGINLRPLWMWPGRICSVSQPFEGRIYVTIPNGVENPWFAVPKPDAPSLACLDAETGEIVWTDNSSSRNMLYSEFSSPLVAKIGGRGQVVVAQGDGWIRSFKPATGELIWKFDINEKTSGFHATESTRNYFLGTPVLYDDRIYIASGQEAQEGNGPGRLVCIDPTKEGDISRQLATDLQDRTPQQRRVQTVDPQRGEKAIENPNSGLFWELTSEQGMHRSLASVAVHDGLVIATDIWGLVHCVDAKTGKKYWEYDCFGPIWGSPLIVRDIVYVANQDGVVFLFRLAKDPKVALNDGEPIRQIKSGNACSMSPVFANGRLYIADRWRLYAISHPPQDRYSPKRTSKLGQWPQWRGPQRDNRSSETGLLKQWPEEGPPRRYRVRGLGEGIASLAIDRGRLFTTTYDQSVEWVVCLDQQNGSLLWATEVGPAVPESRLMRWLSQRCPTIDDERLYLTTAAGELVCLSVSDGRERWRRNYKTDFHGKAGWWGYCDFPLVDGDHLICAPGGTKSTVVALDKMTGKVRWRCPIATEPGSRSQHEAGYAASVKATIHGKDQYLVSLSGTLASISASDGRLLWRDASVASHQASLTPIVIENDILCAGGHPTYGITRLAFDTDESGPWHVQQKYHSDVRLNHFQDSWLRFDDAIFATDRDGPLCLSAMSGTNRWKAGLNWREITAEFNASRRSSNFIAATFAEDRLYLRGANDVMMLVAADPERFEVISSFAIGAPTYSRGATAPVIAGGHLYVRDDDQLYCYDLRETKPAEAAAKGSTIEVTLPAARKIAEGTAESRVPRSVFVPTPHDVVDKMLELAELQPDDRLIDLGSGDGRIVIRAAVKYGADATGVEIDDELIEHARASAKKINVASKVSFRKEDLFDTDLSDADVIAVYLLPKQLEKLVSKFDALADGIRIVSHEFEIPGVAHAKRSVVRSDSDGALHHLYLYETPLLKHD